jgi:ribosome-binding protein aMBF1 (putative translation factor)
MKSIRGLCYKLSTATTTTCTFWACLEQPYSTLARSHSPSTLYTTSHHPRYHQSLSSSIILSKTHSFNKSSNNHLSTSTAINQSIMTADIKSLSDAELAAELTKQADTIKALKAKKVAKAEIQPHVDRLLALKTETALREEASKEKKFDRQGLESLLLKRFFYAPSFSIYGGELFFDLFETCSLFVFHKASDLLELE